MMEFTAEQEAALERIENDLRHINAVLRILVWSRTGEWPPLDDDEAAP